MDKYAETDFTRFLYSVGSEASSENKKNSRRSKQNSIESMSRSICEIYGFGQETSGGYWKSPLHKARVHMCIQELVHEYEQVMNTARTRSPRSDLCWEEQKTYQSWGKRGKVAAAFWRVQGDAAAKGNAEDNGGGGALRLATRGRRRGRARREEKKWPFGPIYKAKDMCQARESRDRRFWK